MSPAFIWINMVLHNLFSAHLGLFFRGMASAEYSVINVELCKIPFMTGNCIRYVRYSGEDIKIKIKF